MRMFILLIFNLNLFYANTQPIPLIIKDNEKAISELIRAINRQMPKNSSLLIYPPNFMNIDEQTVKIINSNIYLMLSTQESIYGYKSAFIMNIIKSDEEIARIYKNSFSEEELVGIANLLDKDAAVFINITEVKNHNKKRMNGNSIYLLQAAVFNPADNSVIFRHNIYFTVKQ